MSLDYKISEPIVNTNSTILKALGQKPSRFSQPGKGTYPS